MSNFSYNFKLIQTVDRLTLLGLDNLPSFMRHTVTNKIIIPAVKVHEIPLKNKGVMEKNQPL